MADDRDVTTAVVESLFNRFVYRQALGAFGLDVNTRHTEDVASTFATAMLNRPIDRSCIDAKHPHQFPRQFSFTACAFIALHPTHFFPLRFQSHLCHCMTSNVLLFL